MEKQVVMMIFVVISLVIIGCGDNREKIIVGMDISPLGQCDERGEFFGLDVDLARATAERMGVTVEFKKIDWNTKEAELNSGKIDIIWNGMDITPERQEIMLFSKPYMDNRHIIMILKEKSTEIQRESDLDGKKIGAKAGTTSEFCVEQDNDLKNSISEFKTYITDEETFNALEKGEIDAVICDEIVGRYEMIQNRNEFAMVDVTIGKTSKFGIGFRKNDVELRDRVQKAFDEIVRDGTAKKISEKWFQADLIIRNVR